MIESIIIFLNLKGMNKSSISAFSFRAIFKKKKYNHILIHVFDLLGTNSYNWKNRHVGAHHLYPNIMNYDSDIQQTSIVKIFFEILS